MAEEFRSPLTRALNRAPDAVFSLYAVAAAFTAYFCMYAFRKPFSAASYEEVELTLTLFGRSLEPKTIFVISQIIGYCLSKYLGTTPQHQGSDARAGQKIPQRPSGEEYQDTGQDRGQVRQHIVPGEDEAGPHVDTAFLVGGDETEADDVGR